VRRARTHPLGTRSSTIFGRSSSRNGSKRVANTLLRKDLDELLPEQVEVCADLHLRPYYGDEDDTDGLYHSVAKRGTTAFHAYATLYARVKNKRYTLAVRRLSKTAIPQVVSSLSSSVSSTALTPGQGRLP